MDFNCKKITGMENRTGLTMEDFILLQAIQRGDEIACNRLYMNHQGEVISMHRYGPDGTHPKQFGFSWSSEGACYEEASGYCYICFRECALRYDMDSGKPFMAWVRGVFAKRAHDWVDDRNPDGWKRCEEDVMAASTDVFRQDDLEMDAAHEEDVLTAEGMEQIRSYIRKCDTPELDEFVDTWLKLGNTKKNPITCVAAAMGVTRQTSYNYMNAVKALVKGKFGDHFYGRG